ncbi:bacteriohemerythrin [Stutzerimonas tarimensis]|uniref:Bacteriohemerythrin n=1 Tax=Stutzerimonas tarimensis TaxID=1507735 RepID=A0ABV7T1M8_9GAMM
MGIRIEWSDEYETGIDIIDEQHKRLFDYFNEIDACIASGEADKVAQVARGLIDYAVSHNAFEETLMEQAAYPMLEAHRKIHATFAERAEGYLDKLNSGSDPMKLAREIRVDIGLWLINHIKREDQHYAPVVKKSLDQGFVSRMLGKIFG